MTGAPLQPNLKAASTAQHSQLSAVASGGASVSRVASPAPQRRPQRQDLLTNDYLSDKATLSLVKRILVTESNGVDKTTPSPIEGLLPPLTSSNEVDIQLYAIIAVVIKDFVHPWYTRITPDETFVDEIIHVIAHCTRAIEQRLRQVDLADLALNEIPSVFQRHVQDFRIAQLSHEALPYSKDLVHVYHALNPHPALDPGLSTEERATTERLYRQLLIQGALAVLMPTEDLQNSSLRTLVTDAVADLILGRVVEDRLCHGWFLHEAISKATAILSYRAQPKVTGQELQADARGRLEKFGLLATKDEASAPHSRPLHQSSVSSWFWAILQWFYLAVVGFRFIIIGILQARRHPATIYDNTYAYTTTAAVDSKDGRSRLVLDYALFSMISTLLNLSIRMPWFVGSLAFARHCLTSGRSRPSGLGSTIDRFLHRTLTKHLLPPTLLPLVLRNLRATVFPFNSLGPPAPPPPSPTAALTIRATAATDILRLLPRPVVRVLFPPQVGGAEEHSRIAHREVEELLDVLGDERLNKYWIYGLLELVICRLVPEMMVQTPTELLEERGVQFAVGRAVADETGENLMEETGTQDAEPTLSPRPEIYAKLAGVTVNGA